MRLFFLKSHTVQHGDGTTHYRAGYFYQVDDAAEADELVKFGIAETEEQHEQHLAEEAAAAEAAKQ